MNHIVQFQPPHLDGKWQIASLNRRGGHPVCGCTVEEGHDTAEEAHRHHHETDLAYATMRSIHETDSARKCERCGEWTPKVVMGPWPGRFSSVLVFLCDEHLPTTDDEVRAVIEATAPFHASYEAWES